MQTEADHDMDAERDNFIGTDTQSRFVEDDGQDELSDSNEYYWISELYEIMHNTNKNNVFGKTKNWREFIEKQELYENVTTPVDKSRGEILLMILKFSISNDLSLTGLTNLFKLINSMFKTPILPDSRYMIDNLLNPKEGVEHHAICKHCSVYLGKFAQMQSNIICNVCNTNNNLKNSNDSSFFTLIDPTPQIADLLSQHEDHFNFVTNQRVRRRGYMTDVYDGKKYQEFVKSIPHEKGKYVTAVFNTDGAPKFKCSKFSIWPLYLMLNELPKEIRTKKLVTCGLMFTDKKPNMSVFIDKFVDLITKCRIPVVIKNEERILKLYVLSCCVDAVARAPVQGLTQYNGRYGCNWCLHPGVFHGIIKYPLTTDPVPLRNHDDTVALMLNANPENPAFGVKYPSPLINLTNFDIIEGFTPDYMHMALEGVAKQFTNYYVDVLHENVIKEFDKTMKKIAVPQQISRYTRPLSCRNNWKAREWENFVLYYSIKIFPIFVSTAAMRHWLLFVEALYILLKDNIHIDELNKADEMLHQFVSEVEYIYNVKAMTYNVHILLHTAKSVLNWGPLWTNSTFSFESANQHLLNATKCAKGVTHQVVRFINISHSCLLLQEKVIHEANDVVARYCNDIILRRVESVQTSNSNILYFHGHDIDTEILNALELSIHSTEFFYKMVKDHCLYESHLISKTRSNNSFALLKDGNFIRIIGFIYVINEGTELTVCNYVETKQCFATSYKACQTVCRIHEETVAIPTNSITKICVYMDVDNTCLIPVPNILHY